MILKSNKCADRLLTIFVCLYSFTIAFREISNFIITAVRRWKNKNVEHKRQESHERRSAHKNFVLGDRQPNVSFSLSLLAYAVLFLHFCPPSVVFKFYRKCVI